MKQFRMTAASCQVHGVLDQFVRSYRAGDLIVGDAITLEETGSFTVGSVHASWAKELLLWAYDYHERSEIEALQVLPVGDLRSIDVPDLSREWSPTDEPVWRWLKEPWDLPVESTSTAMTNILALKGEPITEVARWEDRYWEMFAGPGPDVPEGEARAVPLATLVGADPSLRAVADLKVGQALYRTRGGDWSQWNPGR